MRRRGSELFFRHSLAEALGLTLAEIDQMDSHEYESWKAYAKEKERRRQQTK